MATIAASLRILMRKILKPATYRFFQGQMFGIGSTRKAVFFKAAEAHKPIV
jgi:hypothetical protein